MSLIILKMKIIFRMIPIIQIAVKRIKSNLTKIETSIGQALYYWVPEVVQLVYRFRAKIGTSNGQALVSKNKHIQTNQNIDKQEKEKKNFIFLSFYFKNLLKKIR